MSDGDSADHSRHSVAENGVETLSSTSPRVPVNSSTPDTTDSSRPVFPVTNSDDEQHFPAASQPHSSSGKSETVVLQSSTQSAKKSTANVELVHTKQLIRMSVDNVVTESASLSDWFWSKKSEQTNKTKAAAAGTGSSPKKTVSSSTKPARKSSGRHREPARRNEKHELAAEDGHARVMNSCASAGDVSSQSSSDVESSANVTDHLRFAKHSSVDGPVASTPIRGSASSETQTVGYQEQQISSSSNTTRPPSEAVPTSPLSYAFILPETSISSPCLLYTSPSPRD